MDIMYCEIEGIVPILFNRFTDEAQKDMEGATARMKKTREELIKQAEGKVYRKPGIDEIGIPADNIKKCILEGCKQAGVKLGKKSAEPFLRAGLHLKEDFVPIKGKYTFDGIHECSGRIPPRTGARVILFRPYVDSGWEASFRLVKLDTMFSWKTVEAAIQRGGIGIGLCDHRPEYGRFILKNFKEVAADGE